MKGIFLVILKPTFEHFLIKLLLKCYFWDTFLTKIHRRKILILQNSGQILSKMIVLCSLRKDSEFFSYIVRIFPQLKTFSKVCLSNSVARCYYVVVVVVASYARARISELT